MRRPNKTRQAFGGGGENKPEEDLNENILKVSHRIMQFQRITLKLI